MMVAIVACALIAAAPHLPSWATLAILAALLAALIAWETRRYAELRERLRRQLIEGA
jgi:hypothetical protein